MLERIKVWFRNDIEYDPQNITIVTGVDGFLTEAARTHKRNLLYATLVLASFIWIVGDQNIKSAFGFTVKEGIETKNIIAVITVVVIYELIMLWFYYKDCKCQWFGMSMGKKGELPKFKESTEQIKVNLECTFTVPDIEQYTVEGSKVIKIIECEKKHLENLVAEWKKQCVVSAYKEMFDAIDTFNQEYKKKHEVANKDCLEQGWGGLIGAEGRLRKVAERLHEQVLNFDSVTRPDHERDTLLGNFMGSLNNTERGLKTLVDHIAKLETEARKVSRQLVSLQRGYQRYKRVDFLFPTVFSIVILLISICQIFDIPALEFLESILLNIKLKFLQLVTGLNAA
ncbi:hypothetical protein ACOJUY_001350 [Vibrio alginolyticus]